MDTKSRWLKTLLPAVKSDLEALIQQGGGAYGITSVGEYPFPGMVYLFVVPQGASEVEQVIEHAMQLLDAALHGKKQEEDTQ